MGCQIEDWDTWAPYGLGKPNVRMPDLRAFALDREMVINGVKVSDENVEDFSRDGPRPLSLSLRTIPLID